jgi:hypothetical protein
VAEKAGSCPAVRQAVATSGQDQWNHTCDHCCRRGPVRLAVLGQCSPHPGRDHAERSARGRLTRLWAASRHFRARSRRSAVMRGLLGRRPLASGPSTSAPLASGQAAGRRGARRASSASGSARFQWGVQMNWWFSCRVVGSKVSNFTLPPEGEPLLLNAAPLSQIPTRRTPRHKLNSV